MRTIVLASLLGCMLMSFYTAAFSQKLDKNISIPASLSVACDTPLEYRLIGFLCAVGERKSGHSQVYAVANNFHPYLLPLSVSMPSTAAGQNSSFLIMSLKQGKPCGYRSFSCVKEWINYAKTNLQIDCSTIYVAVVNPGSAVWNINNGTADGDCSFDACIAAMAPVPGAREKNGNCCSSYTSFGGLFTLKYAVTDSSNTRSATAGPDKELYCVGNS